MPSIARALLPAFAVTAATAVCAAPAFPAPPRPADGLVTAADVSGLRTARASAGAVWPRLLDRGERVTGARTNLLLGRGTPRTAVVSRVAVARPGAAARIRRVPGSRWAALDRSAGGRGVAWNTARRAVWSAGGLTGQVEVVAPARIAAPLLRSLVALVRERALARARLGTWDALTAHTPASGRVSVITALRAFALAVAPLPGVRPPTGPRGDIGEGSMAVRWVLGRLGEMRPAQRRAVEAVLARLRPTAGRGARAAAGTWTANPTDQAIAVQAALDIGARLGIPLTVTLAVGRGPIDDEGADMVTQPLADDAENPDRVTGCVITVGPSGEDYLGEPAAYRALLTHEVFHCFQAQLGGYAAYTAKRPPDANGTREQDRNWMYEGGADWAACEVAPDPEASYIPVHASKFVTTPATPLFERSYDGLGFLRFLTARGVDLWSRWPAILGAKGDAATFAATGAEPALDSWASFTFREPQLGNAWDLQSRCIAAKPKAPRSELALVDGQSAPVAAPAYTTKAYDVRSDADVVTFRIRGRARLGADGIDELDLADRSYCTDPDGCRCPPRAGPVPEPPPLGEAPARLALTGGVGGASGEVLGRTIYDYCRVKPPQLIIPGKAAGKLYVGQTRRSVLRTIGGWRPSNAQQGLQRAPTVFLPGGLLGTPALNVAFGICSPAVLEDEAGTLAACRRQFPKGDPNVVGAIAVASPDYATREGLGPGSPADAVVARVGTGFCRHEIPSDPESAWDSCTVPAAGTRATLWDFTGSGEDASVLGVSVFDSAITPISDGGPD